jgi:hypothetical protein
MKNNYLWGTLVTAIQCIILTIAVVLKLVDIINWPWWVVTSPLWGEMVLLLIGYIRRRRREKREDEERARRFRDMASGKNKGAYW